MISGYQHNDRSGIGDLLDMVARKAPFFMRAGGGPLRGEEAHRARRKPKFPTADQIARAEKLLRAGQYSRAEIARMVQIAPRSVYNIARRIAVRVRDARKIQ